MNRGSVNQRALSRGLEDGGGLSFNFDAARQRGFTLIELVMTLTILTILTLGVIPLVKLSVKRQREQRLREALREMRTAIEEFIAIRLGCSARAASPYKLLLPGLCRIPRRPEDSRAGSRSRDRCKW